MDGIPHFFEALPLALQHVVAMIVAVSRQPSSSPVPPACLSLTGF